jgi:hypothetical protein
VTTQPGKTVGNSRIWNVTSTVSGKVRIEARVDDGSTWDWVELLFTVPPNTPGTDDDKRDLLAAVQSGQIVGATQQIKAVLQNSYLETSNGIVTLAGSMLPVLVAPFQDRKALLTKPHEIQRGTSWESATRWDRGLFCHGY